MSADNGWLLRKNQEGKFCLQMYFASADEYPKIALTGPNVFGSVEDALAAYEKQESDGYPSEYGLTVRITEVTYDHTHKMESWGNYGQRCAVTDCTYTRIGPIDSVGIGRGFDEPRS